MNEPKTSAASSRSQTSLGPPDSLGVIAGNRNLPLLFCEQARRMGVRRLVAVAFDGETNPELARFVDEIVWLKIGQLSKLIAAFRDRNITQCVMAGQIAPKNLFDLRPDLRALGLLLRLKEKNAHTLFGAIADELQKDGVTLIPALPWLKPLMPQPGFRLGRPLSDAQRDDVAYGLRIAKEISRLDIGQTVVVKNGVVLAVEGFEGTDACLARGGELAGKEGGAVAIKVAKKNHDMRFDIPCTGPNTIETCAKAGIRVLAIEGGKTLVLDQRDAELLTAQLHVTLIATETVDP
jgi:UDP-2,3-diacylglucosamine hydrolase